MRIVWWKSKFHKVIEELSQLHETVEDMNEYLQEREEKDKEDNKVITQLREDNKQLNCELLKKNEYIEKLLLQLIGDANIKNIIAPPKQETALDRYIAKKNGQSGGYKPKLPG